jgi:tetratricopeptide (TPR) repeat protein
MRVAHIDSDKEKQQQATSTYSECIATAKELEQNNELEEAIKAYKKCLAIKKTDEYVFDRLMILFRKQKEYKKELDIIQQAISAFEKLYAESAPAKTNKLIQKISNSILRSTGLSDKKGNLVYKPQPLLRWYKRATLVKKRLKK